MPALLALLIFLIAADPTPHLLGLRRLPAPRPVATADPGETLPRTRPVLAKFELPAVACAQTRPLDGLAPEEAPVAVPVFFVPIDTAPPSTGSGAPEAPRPKPRC